jgi:hypothetical protein
MGADSDSTEMQDIRVTPICSHGAQLVITSTVMQHQCWGVRCECGIVRSNFSPFNLNILLLNVPERKYVTREWRKLLHNLYSSPGHVALMEQGRKVYKVFVGNHKGKRPLGRRSHRREDGIRMNLRDNGRGVNWIRLAQDRDRWRAIVIYRWIYIDTSRSINIDMSRWVHTDISRSIHIYRSIDYYRYISIEYYRSISIYLDRHESIYRDRLIL